jgi:hypothetical protein
LASSQNADKTQRHGIICVFTVSRQTLLHRSRAIGARKRRFYKHFHPLCTKLEPVKRFHVLLMVCQITTSLRGQIRHSDTSSAVAAATAKLVSECRI